MTRPNPHASRIALLTATATLLLLAVPATADAQDCGSWREPVLCTGDLQARGADGRWSRLDPREPLRIAPGASVDLELTGRDQTGRTFPAYRLFLDVDDRECDRHVTVENRGEGRLTLTAARTEGRCRLDVWVPGNLNFAWRLDVEIARAARVGYERDEAQIVARRLYQAILGREADASGLAAAAAEIERGNLETQIRAMLASDEFRQKQMGLDSEQLLAQFYRGLLEREPDATGTRTFLEDMRYRRYTDVLLGIIRSAEFEQDLERD